MGGGINFARLTGKVIGRSLAYSGLFSRFTVVVFLPGAF